jgi:hypothetical protein
MSEEGEPNLVGLLRGDSVYCGVQVAIGGDDDETIEEL